MSKQNTLISRYATELLSGKDLYLSVFLVVLIAACAKRSKRFYPFNSLWLC